MLKVFCDATLTAEPNLKKVKSWDICEMKAVCESDRGKKKVNVWITVWGKIGVNCYDYLHEGSQILVTGDLSQDEFKDKDGNERRKLVINANDVRFMSKWGKKKDEEEAPNKEGEETESVSQEGSEEDGSDLPF